MSDEEVHELLLAAHEVIRGRHARGRFAETTLQTAQTALYALAFALVAHMEERDEEVRRRKGLGP